MKITKKRKIWITGASSGIGRALAVELAHRGHDLALTARRVDVLRTLRDELSGCGVQIEVAELDVSRPEDIPDVLDRLVESLGGLDIAIANAGITHVHRTGDLEHLSQEYQVIQTNVIGAIATLNAAAVWFRRQGYGQLVGISSVAAWLTLPGSATYCASKAALTAWLNAVRAELQPHGIQVLSVHPGFIETDIAPNMKRYPFVISAEKAASSIAQALGTETRTLVVPQWPWQYLVPVLRRIPDRLLQRMI